MKIDLIVARYEEDVDWLKEAGRIVDTIRLYCKGGGKLKGGKRGRAKLVQYALPNVGREPHTFLTYLAEQYPDLPDVMVFAQGNPMAHYAGMIQRLEDLRDGDNIAGLAHGYEGLGDVWAYDDPQGTICFVPWGGNPGGLTLDCGAAWRSLGLDGACPEMLHFAGGGQFILTREAALRLRQEQYAWGAEYLAAPEGDDRRAHEFERIWGAIWGR